MVTDSNVWSRRRRRPREPQASAWFCARVSERAQDLRTSRVLSRANGSSTLGRATNWSSATSAEAAADECSSAFHIGEPSEDHPTPSASSLRCAPPRSEILNFYSISGTRKRPGHSKAATLWEDPGGPLLARAVNCQRNRRSSVRTSRLFSKHARRATQSLT